MSSGSWRFILKIVFHTHLTTDFPDRIAAFAAAHPRCKVCVAGGREQLFSEIGDAEVLVDHRVSEELLSAAHALKWLFVPFTGVDSVPWDLLDARGIRVSNNHGNAAIVAERAVALALAASGRVAEFDRGMRRGHWFRKEGRNDPFNYWRSMIGRPVTILGTGAIGSRIARFLSPWTDDILGFRRSPDAGMVEGFARITGDLREALGHGDLCFVTLPHTPATNGLIGEDELRLLEGRFLVNVSRGGIVREEPLYRALKDGVLAGAALDVWYRYPQPFAADCFPSGLNFHELENLVLSPHAGSHTAEGKAGQLDGVIGNLTALIEQGEPVDIVTPAERY